jgi:5,10-methenyltetrahydromethanopterin hydrogenase
MKFNAILNYLAFASTMSEEAFNQFKELIEKQQLNNNEETQEEMTLEELKQLGIIIEK